MSLQLKFYFFLRLCFSRFLRAGNPELDGTERPMELMFINSILRSQTFPPHDSWLSGYAISYYYFGYVMTAMLAKLAGLTGSVAHNLMTSLIFAEQLNKIKPGLILKPWLHLETSVLMGTLKSFSE